MTSIFKKKHSIREGLDFLKYFIVVRERKLTSSFTSGIQKKDGKPKSCSSFFYNVVSTEK